MNFSTKIIIPKCPQNAFCHNIIGSFRCKCGKGYIYKPDLNHCIDIDECSTKVHNCDPRAKCVNITPEYGEYLCECNQGWLDVSSGLQRARELKGCKDFDECANKADNCDDEKVCINTQESFYCQ